jgi:hypothetical protein
MSSNLMESQTEQLLKEGKAAARRGDKVQARSLLTQVVESDPRSEEAWMWLSGVVADPQEQQICLENVLVINPQNEQALKGLQFISVKTGVLPRVAVPQTDQLAAGGASQMAQPAQTEEHTSPLGSQTPGFNSTPAQPQWPSNAATEPQAQMPFGQPAEAQSPSGPNPNGYSLPGWMQGGQDAVGASLAPQMTDTPFGMPPEMSADAAPFDPWAVSNGDGAPATSVDFPPPPQDEAHLWERPSMEGGPSVPPVMDAWASGTVNLQDPAPQGDDYAQAPQMMPPVGFGENIQPGMNAFPAGSGYGDQGASLAGVGAPDNQMNNNGSTAQLPEWVMAHLPADAEQPAQPTEQSEALQPYAPHEMDMGAMPMSMGAAPEHDPFSSAHQGQGPVGPMGPYSANELPSPSDLPGVDNMDAQSQPWYIHSTNEAIGKPGAGGSIGLPSYLDEANQQPQEHEQNYGKAKEIRTIVCPSCRNNVPETSLACPDCGFNFFVNCPHCHELIDTSDAKAGVPPEPCPYCGSPVDKMELGLDSSKGGSQKMADPRRQGGLFPSMQATFATGPIRQVGLSFNWVIDLLWLIAIVAMVWVLTQLPTWLHLTGQY